MRAEELAAASTRKRGARISRRDVLSVARDLFERQGYEGTTTDDIAAAARITKRSLYRHFGSKEQLLYELHDGFLGDLLTAVENLSGSPEERLRSVVGAHIGNLREHGRDVKVFYEEVKHIGSARQGDLLRRQQEYERAVVEILRDGVETGDFTVADPKLAAKAILGGLTDCYRWFDTSDTGNAGAIADELNRLILHGVEPPNQPGTPVRLTPRLASALQERATTAGESPVDRIVTAATHLFSTRGYHSTTTQQIADRAGITKGALYYHVKYKEEILVQIMRNLLDRYLSILDLGRTLDLPVPQRIASYIIGQTYAISLDREAVAVLIEEQKYLPDDMAPEIDEKERFAYSVFQQSLVEGTTSGVLDPVDLRVANLFMTGMVTFAYRWYQPGDGLDVSDLGVRFAELALHGVRTRPKRRQGSSRKR
ncbi:TetR family transcriptional regulator [Streptomyces sp. E5N91]|uniref:TetR family transcriptional regulator n=1 Tax=Streptomyces sp. E5N91 TaxID=1851996 RepID=UPI000EF57CCC|nr:TetR family transcriptional regulator [Streptomyces sp. E5N91]